MSKAVKTLPTTLMNTVRHSMKNHSDGFVEGSKVHKEWKRKVSSSSREEIEKKKVKISKLRLRRQPKDFEILSYDDGAIIGWDRWAHTNGVVSCVNSGNFEPPQPHYTDFNDTTWGRCNTKRRAYK